MQMNFNPLIKLLLFVQQGEDLISGQLIFKYVFSKLFQSKRLLKCDTYMES